MRRINRSTDIQLPAHLRERLAQGHPWVYRNHIAVVPRLESGSWVRVQCGGWSGIGSWDADGPIAIRLFAAQQPPDAAWLAARVREAWELRAPLRHAGCTAYRWLFGEGDGLPGMTVDRYGDYAVMRTYGGGAARLAPQIAEALMACDPALSGVVRRIDADATDATDDDMPGDSSLAVLAGNPPPQRIDVVEYDMQFAVDLRIGQKTGLFLDHRENRRLIEQFSADRSVLNCFAYTGAFSLYALRGGARSVVSVDIGKGLAAATAANIALNRLDAGRHRFITEDCFTLLNRFAEEGKRFDMLILDPPSFARSRQSRYAAQRAYVKLNALALRCVVPGGLLATASCTSQIGPEEFKEAIAAAGAVSGRRLQIIHEAGQPLDHPVPAHFPEGRYLKFVIGRVLAESRS
ncbi:MAG TPA: class I SAM-dependent rRNA methyltransferase [Roseiflexaceae bacterium]|nr:class I SAM-dependent rRNA methyltransferase [Roseiflexaceae bacterium]